MGMIAVTIVVLALSVAGVLATMILLRKQVFGSVGSEATVIVGQIGEATKATDELLQYKSSYASKAQLDSLSTKTDDVKADLEKFLQKDLSFVRLYPHSHQHKYNLSLYNLYLQSQLHNNFL